MVALSDSDDSENDDRTEWRVGTAKASITPDPSEPHVLYGFRARENETMDGIDDGIHARAVAVEDRSGRRLLFVSVELMFVTREMRSWLEDYSRERWDIDPDALVLSPSHTHYAPRYRLREKDLDEDATDEERLIAEYREMVEETLLTVIDEAVGDLEPASLAYYHAKCGMATNRRRPAEDFVHFNANPDGPTAHDVPVLAADAGGDEPKAILFGYACHPTVGTRFNEVSGDWPGYAMSSLEEDHPGTTALFLIGCAGNQKAYPQGTREWVRRHAQTAVNAVERALVTDTVGDRSEPYTLDGELTIAADDTVLDLHEQLEDENGEPDGVRVKQRRYPMQAISFGGDLTMMVMSGEVVAEISNRLKDSLQGPLWTAAYANPAGYIVTDRILAEGGSEARSSGLSGMRYARGTADRVVDGATALAQRVGGRRR